MKTFGFLFCSKELYWILFELILLEKNIEPLNLDFCDFGQGNLFLMLMVYRIGLIGKFFGYVNSIAVRSFRLDWTVSTSSKMIEQNVSI